MSVAAIAAAVNILIACHLPAVASAIYPAGGRLQLLISGHALILPDNGENGPRS
jgi:hypothetical protein